MNLNWQNFKPLLAKKFPSPTGVNHYEFQVKLINELGEEFPSPTGVNHYEFGDCI